MIPKIYISDWKLKGNGFQYICILMKAIKMNFNSIYITVFKRTFDNNHLESFFFIKYRENDHFIKLRLLSKSNDSIHLYHEMMQLKQKWLKESELSTYAIVDYQPEINRYGGIETIEIIEDYFMYDSWLAIYIIDQTFNYPKEFIVAITIIFNK